MALIQARLFFCAHCNQYVSKATYYRHLKSFRWHLTFDAKQIRRPPAWTLAMDEIFWKKTKQNVAQVQLLGSPRRAEPDDKLKQEFIECFAGLEEKVFEWEEMYGCNWNTSFYDRCCVAGATYQTWCSDTTHRRVRCIIRLRWTEATGEAKVGLGILLKIMILSFSTET